MSVLGDTEYSITCFLFVLIIKVSVPSLVWNYKWQSIVLSSGSKRLYRYSHFESGEVASRVVKVTGWKLCHLQFGYQVFFSAQDSPHCNVLKL